MNNHYLTDEQTQKYCCDTYAFSVVQFCGVSKVLPVFHFIKRNRKHFCRWTKSFNSRKSTSTHPRYREGTKYSAKHIPRFGIHCVRVMTGDQYGAGLPASLLCSASLNFGFVFPLIPRPRSIQHTPAVPTYGSPSSATQHPSDISLKCTYPNNLVQWQQWWDDHAVCLHFPLRV